MRAASHPDGGPRFHLIESAKVPPTRMHGNLSVKASERLTESLTDRIVEVPTDFERQIAKLSAEMEAFKVQYANPMFRLPMTFIEIFPVGVLVSLVSARLLRNPRFLAARRS